MATLAVLAAVIIVMSMMAVLVVFMLTFQYGFRGRVCWTATIRPISPTLPFQYTDSFSRWRRLS
jgi:hypothetical protein